MLPEPPDPFELGDLIEEALVAILGAAAVSERIAFRVADDDVKLPPSFCFVGAESLRPEGEPLGEDTAYWHVQTRIEMSLHIGQISADQERRQARSDLKAIWWEIVTQLGRADLCGQMDDASGGRIHVFGRRPWRFGRGRDVEHWIRNATTEFAAMLHAPSG